ncbi:MAG: DUF6352 family protein [Paracoccus sp. (in: a-proteobacteria)]|nr:DUF6352 family protein [Paracoccus sp. (in: a-proteobacteria)]
MPEFWVASGHHLTRLDRQGRMEVTDELLLGWLARPELAPPPEACAAERDLFARLRTAPRAPVSAGEIAAMDDADARENWGMFIGLRDRLLDAGSIEAGTLDILARPQDIPPIFRDQLIQLVLRNALDGCDDPFTLRAAELLYRPQRPLIAEGALRMVDAELAAGIDAQMHANPLGAMLSGGIEALDVMSAETAWSYWSRSDAHTMVLPWGAADQARSGFARALEAFLRQLAGFACRIEPLTETGQVPMRWFAGLNAEGSAIGNALWHGDPAPASLIGIFALSPAPGAVNPALEARLAGAPVWLLLGLSGDREIRLKPQNLVEALGLAGRAAVTSSGERAEPCRAN